MEFFQGSSSYCHANNQQFTPEKRPTDPKTENFIVDDLLDFPTDELVVEESVYVNDVIVDTSTDSSTAIDSCNFSLAGDVGCKSFVDTQFSSICVPYDGLAELEWLTKLEVESFSSEEVQKLHLITGVNTRSQHATETHQFQTGTINRTNNLIFNNDMTIPGKTRTKRSRVASSTWASRLLAMSPTVPRPNVNMSSNFESDIAKKNMRTSIKDEIHENSSKNEDGRKCLHCATSKTPQWRSGPMGPKTLCNACGVRYKSGRLVPEYRPASSPTFVLTKHSNSHRKVIELRRQKEMQISQQQQQFPNHQNIMLRMPYGDDYLVHQHMSHDYRQVI